MSRFNINEFEHSVDKDTSVLLSSIKKKVGENNTLIEEILKKRHSFNPHKNRASVFDVHNRLLSDQLRDLENEPNYNTLDDRYVQKFKRRGNTYVSTGRGEIKDVLHQFGKYPKEK